MLTPVSRFPAAEPASRAWRSCSGRGRKCLSVPDKLGPSATPSAVRSGCPTAVDLRISSSLYKYMVQSELMVSFWAATSLLANSSLSSANLCASRMSR